MLPEELLELRQRLLFAIAALEHLHDSVPDHLKEYVRSVLEEIGA
jgi:hypothetical protein